MRLLAGMRRLEGGNFYLVVSGISTVLVYCALLLRLPLIALYSVSLQYIDLDPAAELFSGTLGVTCILVLFVSYALGARALLQMRNYSHTLLLVTTLAAVFVALLLFIFPVTSTDVYDYAFRGWMLAHYQANTFVLTPQAFSSDPLLPNVAWKHVVTAYGPLWERLSWTTAWLFGEVGVANHMSLLLRLTLGYKVVNALGFLLCGAAIYMALADETPRQRLLGVYLWLWNPLVLWETVAAGHNDVWMALPVVVSLWAMRVWQTASICKDVSEIIAPGFALVVLTAGGLVKFLAFFFGPLALAAVLRSIPSRRERWRFVVAAGCACTLLAAVAYAPFWVGLPTLQNISDRRSLFNASWLAAFCSLLAPIVTLEKAQTIASLSGLALLLAGTVWATWQSWQRPSSIVKNVLLLLLWFLFVCNPWFQPWYLVWAVALIALMPWEQRFVLGIGLFCFTGVMSYAVSSFVLPVLGLDRQPLMRELVLSLFIYLPPLCVLSWERLRTALRHEPTFTPVLLPAVMAPAKPHLETEDFPRA